MTAYSPEEERALSDSEDELLEIFPEERRGYAPNISARKFIRLMRRGLIKTPPTQRPLNQKRVKHLAKKHLNRQRVNPRYKPIWCGALVVVEHNGVYYLVDGQHRFNALLMLRDVHGWSLKGIKLNIDYHYTYSDQVDYDHILDQCGDTYGHSGAPPRDSRGETRRRIISHEERDQLIEEVWQGISSEFGGQVAYERLGRRIVPAEETVAPKFSLLKFKERLKTRSSQKLFYHLEPYQIVERICEANTSYEAYGRSGFDPTCFVNPGSIRPMSESQRRKCNAGLYLVYLASNCKWLDQIKWN